MKRGHGRVNTPFKRIGTVESGRQMPREDPAHRAERRGRLREKSEGVESPSRQEKPLAQERCCRPYRKPTQVGEGKCPQVNERTSVKELGKIAPYLRKKGRLGQVKYERMEPGKAAENRLKRLFTKNTGPCESEN